MGTLFKNDKLCQFIDEDNMISFQPYLAPKTSLPVHPECQENEDRVTMCQACDHIYSALVVQPSATEATTTIEPAGKN